MLELAAGTTHHHGIHNTNPDVSPSSTWHISQISLSRRVTIISVGGEYDSAIAFYSQAIQKESRNPQLFTNRAMARLKLGLWQDVIDDCLKSIEILRDPNMKAFYYLGEQISCLRIETRQR